MAQAFLKAIKNFINYRLVQNALVTKILFRGTQAYGVEFYYGTDTTTKYTAFATKEIIVCAGSILSPVLMMRSGVGPEDVLGV